MMWRWSDFSSIFPSTVIITISGAIWGQLEVYPSKSWSRINWESPCLLLPQWQHKLHTIWCEHVHNTLLSFPTHHALVFHTEKRCAKFCCSPRGLRWLGGLFAYHSCHLAASISTRPLGCFNTNFCSRLPWPNMTFQQTGVDIVFQRGSQQNWILLTCISLNLTRAGEIDVYNRIMKTTNKLRETSLELVWRCLR